MSDVKKAYDFKLLAEKLKGQGLALAEDAAEKAFDATIEWLEESAKLSATPYDDMALILVPQIKKIAKEQIDKIDGQEG